VAVHPQGRQPIYRLHLDSGTTFDCGGPHLWAVDAFVSTGGKPRYQKRRMVVDTDWLIARYGGLGVKPNPKLRVSLPMVEPVRFAGTTPPTVDPYLVGVLLGDGGLTGSIPVLTTNDPEIVAAVHAAGYTTAAYGKYGHGIHGIKPELAALGMLGARSWEKAVPEAYLWGSPETRLAVLQGLMDTDGGFDGGPSFTSTSRKLAEQVQFLVRSLGGRARLVPRVTSYTHNGVKKQGRESYRVTIVAPFCPFRLERHASKWRAADAGRHKTYAYTVQSIERVDDDEAVCFTVDAPDGLFVGENLVVTHNSWLAARLALMFFEAYTPGTPCDTCGGPCKGGKVITTSSKFEHLRDNLWGELRTAFDRAKRRGLETPGRLILGDLRHEDGPNHFIIGQSASTAEGLQGHHSGHKLIIGDEATAIGDEVQLAITRLLATSDSRLLLIFNPTTPDTYAARMARSGRTKNIKITAWDVPTFTDEPIPPGANLITPDFLEDLKAQGMGPECFDPDTEMLTQRGWLKLPDVTVNDKCMTRTPAGVAEWAPITRTHHYHHVGQMMRLPGRSVDLFTTLGHRFPLVGRGLTRVADFRAEEYLDRAVVWAGEQRASVVFQHGGPGTRHAYRRWEFHPDDFAAFLGWYVSEGNTSFKDGKKRKVVISQMPGKPETEEIRLLLKRMGVGTAYSGHQFSFGCIPLVAWLDEHVGVGSYNKRVPEWIMGATSRLQDIFLAAYAAGDGHALSSGGNVYTTVSEGLRDDLHTLLALRGVAGTARRKVDGKFAVHRLAEARRIWLRKEQMNVVDYAGDVYCISTPLQTFLCRRNGCHPFFSGNSFEWRTSVEAEFWDTGDDLLVPADMYDRCVVPRATLGGVRQLGVDLASYGSDECVIAVRDGDALVDLRTFPSMRMDTFFETHVRKAVEDHQPHYVVYDADGVGAGVIGYAEALQRYMPGGGEIIGFRGAKGVGNRFTNARSAWWWALRRRFEHGRIAVAVSDEKLRAQITDLHYTVTSAGEIRVETKAEMKKRGMSSPDRGDALCYAFAFSEELPRTTAPKPVSEVADFFGVSDRSEAAMWRRVIERREGALLQINPVTGVPDDF